jgi:hypothetical protein
VAVEIGHTKHMAAPRPFPPSWTTQTIVLSLELRLRFLLLPAVDSQVFNIGCNRPANLISAVKLEVKTKVANCPTQT